MKILVFGTGYIGTVLTKLLLNDGHQVRACDNFYKGNCDSLLHYCSDSRFEFMFADVSSENDVKRAVEGVDAIVLLAGLVGFPTCQKQPTLSYLSTVVGAENVISHKPKDVPLFYASTGSVYGALDEVCTESSPTNPKSIYGIHKLIAEKTLLNNGDDNVFIYRFATAFGPSPCMRVNLLINDLVFQAMTQRSLVIFQADFRRTFIHVNDLARSFLYGIYEHENFKYRLYNVGDPDGNFTKREIAEKIRSKIPCSIFYEDIAEDADQRNYNCDYSRILETGWKPSYSVEDGIDQLIKVVPLIENSHRSYS